ncbi:hypothetical protein GGR28_000333 [Lewinella aquimaris]|uniref:Uncharacterized protein n=1 Tax=Neolewinella aquimaris TaxID=1835722 RepID=A0A840E1U9_9BACT|nr:hypothetical protein [Neolewinella aquimaris]MBB4077732.1 hypothetical protein [Neolewinella aquimaris]
MSENKTFGDLINDMSSLDVVTLTGNLTVQVNDVEVASNGNDDGDRPLRFSRIMRELEGRIMKRDSQLSALAATHVSLDKDTVSFVRENLSTDEAIYLNFHNESVKAAGIARAAMADGIAKLLIGNKK